MRIQLLYGDITCETIPPYSRDCNNDGKKNPLMLLLNETLKLTIFDSEAKRFLSQLI
jgi:hypothetical protein